MIIRHLRKLFFALFFLLPAIVQAHCDSIDGPVVNDAQRALSTKKIDPVLKWIQPEDEKEVRAAFERAIEVRKQSKTAQELADQYFFETLVRIHRASEGEGFAGIKPAGQVDPAIAATDKAFKNGDIISLANGAADAVKKGILARFEKASQLRKSAEGSPKKGREFVKAYVELTHFNEAIHRIAREGASHKHNE